MPSLYKHLSQHYTIKDDSGEEMALQLPQNRPHVSSKRNPVFTSGDPSVACHSPKASEYVYSLPVLESIIKGPSLEKLVWIKQAGMKYPSLGRMCECTFSVMFC